MSEETIKVTEPTEMDAMEIIARDNGWKPEDEWKGESPKNGFKTAEDFVKDGFKIQSKQHEKIELLQGTVERVESNIKKMAETEAGRMKKALESQKERLELERQEAFEEQDSEKFNKADKELRDTDIQLNESSQIEADFEAGEKEFLKKNEWYGKNRAMTAYALSIAPSFRVAFPDSSVEEYYDDLEKAVKDQFPNEFVNENRSKSSVSGDKPNGSRSKSKGFDALPPEAKTAYEEISFYSGISKADYAKQVNEQELI